MKNLFYLFCLVVVSSVIFSACQKEEIVFQEVIDTEFGSQQLVTLPEGDSRGGGGEECTCFVKVNSISSSNDLLQWSVEANSQSIPNFYISGSSNTEWLDNMMMPQPFPSPFLRLSAIGLVKFIGSIQGNGGIVNFNCEFRCISSDSETQSASIASQGDFVIIIEDGDVSGEGEEDIRCLYQTSDGSDE